MTPTERGSLLSYLKQSDVPFEEKEWDAAFACFAKATVAPELDRLTIKQALLSGYRFTLHPTDRNIARLEAALIRGYYPFLYHVMQDLGDVFEEQLERECSEMLDNRDETVYTCSFLLLDRNFFNFLWIVKKLTGIPIEISRSPDFLAAIRSDHWPRFLAFLIEHPTFLAKMPLPEFAHILIEQRLRVDLGCALLGAYVVKDLQTAVSFLQMIRRIIPMWNGNCDIVAFGREKELPLMRDTHAEGLPKEVIALSFNCNGFFRNESVVIGLYRKNPFDIPHLLAFDLATEQLVWAVKMPMVDDRCRFATSDFGDSVALFEREKSGFILVNKDSGSLLEVGTERGVANLFGTKEACTIVTSMSGHSEIFFGEVQAGKFVVHAQHQLALGGLLGNWKNFGSHMGFFYKGSLYLLGRQGIIKKFDNCLAAEMIKNRLFVFTKDTQGITLVEYELESGLCGTQSLSLPASECFKIFPYRDGFVLHIRGSLRFFNVVTNECTHHDRLPPIDTIISAPHSLAIFALSFYENHLLKITPEHVVDMGKTPYIITHLAGITHDGSVCVHQEESF